MNKNEKIQHLMFWKSEVFELMTAAAGVMEKLSMHVATKEEMQDAITDAVSVVDSHISIINLLDRMIQARINSELENKSEAGDE